MDNSKENLFRFVEYSPENAERTGYSNYSYWGSVFRNFIKKKSAVAMAIIFFALVIFSFIALQIGKYDFATAEVNPALAFTRPNAEFWFGTDNIGRDYWCQVWYATQVSIALALVVALGEVIIGVPMGCLWGYVRWLDRPMTEVYNIITNIPSIIYMTLISLMIGQSFWIMAGAMIMTGWLGKAKSIRNLVFMYRDREYNLASRCLGTSVWRVIFKNLVPYMISIIILRMALTIPGTIATETTLSYLGLGLDINTPSLGILLRNARAYFMEYPYLLVFPASIVSIITITFYLGGNAFSDASDPRNHV